MSQTWVIKDTAPVDAASRELSAQQCSFTSNGSKFSSISVEDVDTGAAVYVLKYDNFEVAGAEVGLGSYEFNWSGNEAYKTLEFDTTPTGELLAWLQKNATLKTPGMNYQDIHLEDKPLWTQFQTEWANGNYAAAIELLKNAALTNKQLNAAVINDITTVITTLENQKDDSFKTDKIKVATEPPSGMSIGEIYFKMLGAISDYSMPDSYYIDPTEKTATGYDSVKLKALADKTYLTNSTAQLFGESWPNLNVDKALFDLETMLLSITQA